MSEELKLEKRAYETKAVRDLRAALDAKKRVLAVAPTGAGKTVIASMLLKAEPRWRRVLWLAHRVELIDQARARLLSLDVPCGVRCAKYEALHPDHADHEARVQIGSVQTITRQAAFDVDLIVIDEAHRSMARTYQHVAKLRPRAEVLGLTATPRRLDGVGLGNFFALMVVCAKPSQLYEGGYLANPITYAADPETRALLIERLRKVRVSRGEFHQGELGDAVGTNILIGNVVTETLRLVPGVPKVVFAATIEHSKKIAARFKRHGITAVHIDGSTALEDRSRILADLAAGKIEVVCNVEVLTEGWDCPALGAVIIARPTHSLTRFMQIIGRVQRPGGVKQKVILDHGGNAERLQHFPGEDVDWSLERGKLKPKADPIERVRICVECQAVLVEACEECPHCGAEQPKSTRRKLEEHRAYLVRLERERIDKLRVEVRQRAEKIAQEVKAPPGWADKVANAVVSRTSNTHLR